MYLAYLASDCSLNIWHPAASNAGTNHNCDRQRRQRKKHPTQQRLISENAQKGRTQTRKAIVIDGSGRVQIQNHVNRNNFTRSRWRCRVSLLVKSLIEGTLKPTTLAI